MRPSAAVSCIRSRGGNRPARAIEATDPKAAAALRFAAKIMALRGRLAASDLAELRDSGFSDGEACDIVASVLLNLYRSYFNLIADPHIDFPVLRSAHSAN